MIVDVMEKRRVPMVHADNALMNEFFRNVHCPDPRCAARFRPFVPAPAPVQLMDPPTHRDRRLDARYKYGLVGMLTQPLRRLLPIYRVRLHPCC
jgi:hypothetical protein